MTSVNLSLLQLCDSSFPTGSFSHSFGLESYIQEHVVHDEETFSEWLNIYLHEQLVYSDGIAMSTAYDALEHGDLEQFWKIDQLLHVQTFSREVREGTKMIGDRMLKMTEDLFESPVLETYRRQIKSKKCYGHPSLVFAIVGQSLGVNKKTTILHYFYSTILSLVQNGVRAIPLGQAAGQRVLHNFQKELTRATDHVIRLNESDFGIVSPGIELSQMRHERVNIRIFMS